MTNMASEDIAKLAETLAKTQVAGGQLSFKGKSLKLNTAEDGEFPCSRPGRHRSEHASTYSSCLPGPPSFIVTLFVPAVL